MKAMAEQFGIFPLHNTIYRHTAAAYCLTWLKLTENKLTEISYLPNNRNVVLAVPVTCRSVNPPRREPDCLIFK